MIKNSLLALFMTFLFCIESYAKEELVIIQIVSSNRRTFVLQKGLKDGMARGLEIIFGNENTSVVCKAIEVSREYSLWTPVDKNANIPFNKQEFVSMNTHAFGNIAVDIGSGKDNLTPTVDLNIVYAKIRTQDDISLRYSYGNAVSQSSTSVSTGQIGKKINDDVDIEYGFRFRPEIEFSLGARMDYSIYRLNNPELDIPTTRNYLMTSFVYHFLSFSENQNNLYAGISLGFGKSSTSVNNVTSTGLAYILPQLRVGYLIPITKSVAMVGETSVESVVSKENFPNGATQTNSDINAKISIGIRF